MQTIEHLQDHVILCGFGRNGRQAALTLKAHRVSFIVIEKDMHHIQQWLTTYPSLVYLNADATQDEILLKAGITRAKALILTLPLDADNVFIVLSARSLNPHLKIISRASMQGSAEKLRKAGADNIIMPDKIGGTHMATLVSKPDVIEFIDHLSGEENDNIFMESIDYEKFPVHVRDQTLRVVMAWKKTGVNCVGLKTKEGEFIINPSFDTLLTEGTKVIVLGTREQIEAMKQNVEK
jgi:voltage-gated potassium channel